MTGKDDKGFGESFQPTFDLAGAQEFYRSVLATYGHRCAVTGETLFPEELLPHPHLEVVLLQPMALGGTLTPGNCLVAEEQVARHVRRGHVVFDADYRVHVPDPGQIKPAVAPHVVEGRKLFLPSDPLFWPTRDALDYHRRMFSI
jgi:hypothetical protein